MEVKQFEGLPPLESFYHNGSCGMISMLTYDRGLLPALCTVTHTMMPLDKKANTPSDLANKIQYDCAGNCIFNSNQEKFFPTKPNECTFSNKIVREDLVQSNTDHALMDNVYRLDNFARFEDFVRCRLVFREHKSTFEKVGSTTTPLQYLAFQPFFYNLSDGTKLYAYLPLGLHSCAFFVLQGAADHSKVLHLELRSLLVYLNSWALFVDECLSEDGEEVLSAKVSLVNLCKTRGDRLAVFNHEETLCWPQTIYSVCAECFAETNMSQLCGSYRCIEAEALAHLSSEAYKQTIALVQRKNDYETERRRDYHFLHFHTVNNSFMPTFHDDAFQRSSVHRVGIDHFTVRIAETVLEVKLDFGVIASITSSSVPDAKGAIAFSPFLGTYATHFLYLRKDGMLVLQGDVNLPGEELGRVLPDDAENAKLFLRPPSTVFLYWTVMDKHYMNDLQPFLEGRI